MANVLVEESYLQNIASAIREKLGSQQTMTPSQMATNIRSISGGTGLSQIIQEDDVLIFPIGHCLCNTQRIRTILHDQPLIIT